MPPSSLLPVPPAQPPTATGWPPSPPYPRDGRGEEDGEGVPWRRYLAAVQRYKWLIVVIVALGSTAGVMATRFAAPEYEVFATIWISSETPQARGAGPIRAQELLNASAWPELLRSFAVLDRAVHRAGLYLSPATPQDAQLLTDFALAERFRPGKYELRLDGSRFVLEAENAGVVDSGAVGDSIGAALGFQWAPDRSMLEGVRIVRFAVVSPRVASIQLRDRIWAALPANSSLMRIRLDGTDPQLLATTLNAVVDEFVHVAAELKKRHLVESVRQLESQVEYAYTELRAADVALENFRVNTITLPAEGGPVAGGVELTRNPVFDNFFEQKIQLDNVQRDREALERTLVAVGRNELPVNALWAIPSVTNVGRDLSAALTEFGSKDAALRALQQVYTDEHPTVQEHARVLNELRARRIPALVVALVEQLRVREMDLETRIASASRDLRAIPTRTIEEARLKLNRQTRENLYVTLRNRYEEARLAEASTVPDVVGLDAAVAPQRPVRTTAGRILFIAVVGSVGISVGLALLLDHFDKRFRYPEQATGELGLPILGAVPRVGQPRRHAMAEEGLQVVESFRSIRLALSHSTSGASPLQLTVSSPNEGDGKSLVCANLALSFAEAGYRTLLVDGDTRRGSLHTVFDTERSPGLLDQLMGSIDIDAILRATSHENLTLLSAGRRSRRGPELLASQQLVDLFAKLRQRFEVIIVDSPPLGAGVDPFVLGTVTGAILLVLRAGATDRHLARTKLEMFGRLRTRVLGAVLNDIETRGIYRYYSYIYGYEAADDAGMSVAATGASRWGS